MLQVGYKQVTSGLSGGFKQVGSGLQVPYKLVMIWLGVGTNRLPVCYKEVTSWCYIFTIWL